MPQGVIRSYRLFFWSAILVSIHLIFSCQNEDCVSTFNNEMLIGFYDADTLENGDVVIQEKDTIFYSVVADGNDSIFYDVDTIVSVVTLPVDPGADMTAFEFYMIDSVSIDTLSMDPLEFEVTIFPRKEPYFLQVSYRKITQVISEECGVEIGFVNLEVDDSTFPAYEIDSDRLSRFNLENERVNIEVFF
jgi:hypothetical protein